MRRRIGRRTGRPNGWLRASTSAVARCAGEKREEKRRPLDLQKDELPPAAEVARDKPGVVSLQRRSTDELSLIVRALWLIDWHASRIACVSKESAVVNWW